MNAETFPAGNTSVEDLIRYAAHRFAAAGIEFRPTRMSHVIRRAGVSAARDHIDAYLVKQIQAMEEAADRDNSWEGFAYYSSSRAVAGYLDPTPAHAHRNLKQQGWYQSRPLSGGRNV